jgi:FkbM family methyltransferase
LIKVVKRDDVVLDIGANIGFYSELLCNLIGPNGEVHAFEPDNLNFSKLSSIKIKYANLFLHREAVSNENGFLTLYTSDVINVENTTYKPEHYKSSYKVPKVSIDNCFNQGKKINFIKMDIQGAELDALNGMQRVIGENDELIILMEVWNYGLRNFGTTSMELYNLIRKLHLNIFVIHNNYIKLADKETFSSFRNEERYYYNILLSKKSLTYLNDSLFSK